MFDMIKVSHTIFSIPFAALILVKITDKIPTFNTICLLFIAIVLARTAAMIFNRLVDCDIDSLNPRTCNRALPSGLISQTYALVVLGISIISFYYTVSQLGALAWKLATLALVIIFGYSLCKHFTSLSHFVLGLSLALVPAGVDVVLHNTIHKETLLLSCGVLTWVAGFDIIYALQDISFDKKHKLHSLPAYLGCQLALYISRILHVLSILFWAHFNISIHSGYISWLALAIISFILFIEQWLVRNGCLKHINQAFFTINSLVGIIFFLGHFIESKIEYICK